MHSSVVRFAPDGGGFGGGVGDCFLSSFVRTADSLGWFAFFFVSQPRPRWYIIIGFLPREY